VTVSSENFIGLYPYFRMDGLAFKILPYENSEERESIDPQILKDNLLNKYWYRGLADKKIYYDVNTLKLLQNYRSAFLQLAQHHLIGGRKEEAVAMLDKMSEVMPESVIPYNDERTAFLISDLYSQAGRPDDPEARMQHIIPGIPKTRDDAIRTAYFMGYMARNWDKCETLLWELVQANPSDVPYGEFLHLFNENGQYARTKKLLDYLQTRFPGDSTVLSEQRKLEQLMASAAAAGKTASPKRPGK
jgi:tetratricopeptide (TPR) repeat protein